MVNSIKITDYITEDLVDLDLKSKNREGILIELSELLEKSPNITGEEKDIYKALVDREKLGSTGIGKGVAIPHAKTESATGLTVAFGVSREGIDFNSLDEEEVHLFFVFASPNKDSQIYLKVLARISRLIREEEFRENLFNCKTPKEVIDCIREKEENYMKCPFCSSEDTKVVDSRTTIDGSTKRRRECNKCLKRFSTYERFEESTIYVVKKDNRRVKYEREKLLKGLTFATAKRNVSREELDKIITDIERSLQNSLISEISSKDLGEKVLEKLRELDQVAYVRFASVYKEFDDIKSFIEIVEEIKKD